MTEQPTRREFLRWTAGSLAGHQLVADLEAGAAVAASLICAMCFNAVPEGPEPEASLIYSPMSNVERELGALETH